MKRSLFQMAHEKPDWTDFFMHKEDMFSDFMLTEHEMA